MYYGKNALRSRKLERKRRARENVIGTATEKDKAGSNRSATKKTNET